MGFNVRRFFASDLKPGHNFYFWHDPNTSKADRRLLLKIDFTILVYGCLSYWIKYLDSANLSNAYVTGMKEDLGIVGNQYAMMTTYFTIGTAISQIPSNLILTKVPARLWLPGMEFIWSLLTLLFFKVTDYRQIYALRFLVGFLEGSCFVGMAYIIGSWYTAAEIGKRTAIFASCAYAGSMFSGYLQTACYDTLNGRNGLEGWRWLFIVDACISFAVAIFGLCMFPGTPARPTAWYLTQEEKDRAVQRLEEVGRVTHEQNAINWALFKRVFTSWQFAVLVPVWICWSNSLGKFIGTVFGLWLKDSKEFSIEQINNYPTISSGFNIFMMLVLAWVIDWTGRRVLVIYGCFLTQIIGTAVYLSWNVSTAGKFFGLIAGAMDGPTSPIIMAWANLLLQGDAQRRALTIACMNTFGSAVASIVSAYAYATPLAPRFTKGISLSLAFVVLNAMLCSYLRYVEVEEVMPAIEARIQEEGNAQIRAHEEEKSFAEKEDTYAGVVPVATK